MIILVENQDVFFIFPALDFHFVDDAENPHLLFNTLKKQIIKIKPGEI